MGFERDTDEESDRHVQRTEGGANREREKRKPRTGQRTEEDTDGCNSRYFIWPY